MASSRHPTVSVVIPCYNQGRFLREAIDSVLHQTYPAIEVLVVNDGSTDDSAAVAATFAPVRLIEQRNQGAPAARNAGLRRSAGDFLIFLDADDRLLPHAVFSGIESLAAHDDWAFATGHVRLINRDGSPAGVPLQAHARGTGYVELLRSNYIWTPGVVMYRRSALDMVGAFDPSAGGSADYELNMRIARRFKFGCHHQVILEYRQHGENMSADVAYMLKSAVTVRRAQSRYVRRDPAARDAWKEGLEIVQADFGGRLVEQVKSDVRVRSRRGKALRGLLYLLRYYPAGFTTIVSAGWRRLVASAR
jgi:glycosyltransferase involved in cell wall biosynthesis